MMITPNPFPILQTFTPPRPIPAVSFRLAQAEDLLSLNENCYSETDWERFRDHYTYLLKWQENGRCYVLVAEYQASSNGRVEKISGPETNHKKDTIIIGSGQLITRGDTAEIAELVVRQDFRNQGIGTALIQILTDIARQRATDLLEIGVAVENQAALRLYRRLGFGRERTIQLPIGQEAVILSKRLI